MSTATTTKTPYARLLASKKFRRPKSRPVTHEAAPVKVERKPVVAEPVACRSTVPFPALRAVIRGEQPVSDPKPMRHRSTATKTPGTALRGEACMDSKPVRVTRHRAVKGEIPNFEVGQVVTAKEPVSVLVLPAGRLTNTVDVDNGRIVFPPARITRRNRLQVVEHNSLGVLCARWSGGPQTLVLVPAEHLEAVVA